MVKKIVIITLLVLVLAGNAFTFSEAPISILDLYDNTAHQSGLKANWGFSRLITGMEKTILFDTGQKGSILMSNLKKPGIDPHHINFKKCAKKIETKQTNQPAEPGKPESLALYIIIIIMNVLIFFFFGIYELIGYGLGAHITLISTNLKTPPLNT